MEEKILLGKPPWSEEHLRECYFRDFQRTREEIDHLPGGVIFNESMLLRLSLNIFLDAVDDLTASINRFKFKSIHPEFWHKTNRLFADRTEISIQRGILSSTMCAMALVDHSREFNRRYPVDRYEDQVENYFHRNMRHKFIHSLRRYIAHVRFTEANWKITIDREGKKVNFLFDKEELLRFGDWDSLSKSFILKHEKGIDVEELFYDYSCEVRKFHSWLRVSLLEAYGSAIAEYLCYLRLTKRFGSASNWSLLIHQVIPQGDLDPYIYLDQYLTDDEIEEVLALPYRSKAQIDRIIELIDDYQVCTDSMRKEAYKICKSKEQ